MAAAHGYAGLIPIAAGKGVRKSVHTRIFSNDVAGAAIAHIAKLFPEGFQQLQRSFPQGGYAHDGRSFLTLLAALSISSVRQGMLHSAVQNQHGDGLIVHRNQLIFQRGAIQLESHALLAVGRNKLVHDAAGNVHEFMFHGLPDQGYFLGIYFNAGKSGERRTDGNFKSGTGGEAAAAGHIAVNQHIHRPDFYAAPVQVGQNAADIIGPERFAGNQGVFHRNFMDLVTQGTAKAVFAHGGGSHSHNTMVIKRHRHHKTVIIIRVLTNKVHTSRCRCHMSRRLTEILDEIRSHRFFRDFSLN